MQLKVYNLYVMIVMLINTILSSWSVLFYFCHHGFFFHFKMKSCLKFIWIKLPEKDEQRWTQIKINTLKDKTLFIFMNFLYSKKKKWNKTSSWTLITGHDLLDTLISCIYSHLILNCTVYYVLATQTDFPFSKKTTKNNVK